MGVLDGEEFDRWRSQAERTMATAGLAAGGGSHGWACSLYEHAAQLAVKGLLHGVGEEAWGHDLPQLVARATAALGETWPSVAEVAEELSRHYIPARYPDAHPSGTPEDHYNALSSDLARSYAERVLGAVDAAWAVLHRPGDDRR